MSPPVAYDKYRPEKCGIRCVQFIWKQKEKKKKKKKRKEEGKVREKEIGNRCFHHGSTREISTLNIPKTIAFRSKCWNKKR